MSQRSHNLLWCLGCWLLLGLALWLCIKVLLPWVLPFFLALCIASLLEPGVEFACKHLGLPRWLAAGMALLLLLTVVVGVLFFLALRLNYELTVYFSQLPQHMEGLDALVSQGEAWGNQLIGLFPAELGDQLLTGWNSLLEEGLSLPNRLYQWLVGSLNWMMVTLPQAFLFLCTTLLASYFTSVQRPALKAFLLNLLPEAGRHKLRQLSQGLRHSLGGWLRAQGTLMLLTFGELSLGFFLLRVDLAFLLAALVALLDALPVFGTGTVLLPWALLSFLEGNSPFALGLLALYGVITLVRNLLEPGLIGATVGLSPLATLFALYVGVQLLGVVGFFLAPLLAVLLRELYRSGVMPGYHMKPID